MSASILSHKHITTMLAITHYRTYSPLFYSWDGTAHPISHDLTAAGQILVEQNVRSVNYRYEDSPHIPTETVTDYKHTSMHRNPPAPVDVLKACQCYAYQSCETPDWMDTQAQAICQRIKDHAIDCLPGYDAAPWEII